MRLQIFWAIFAGLWVALPAFQDWVDPRVFAFLCVGASLTILGARLTNQKGFPDVE